MAEIDPLVLIASKVNPHLLELASQLQLMNPPALVRLEPDSTTGDPAPGSEARLADPHGCSGDSGSSAN